MKKIDTKQIGKRIRELRELKGLSQQNLSHLIGIPRPSISQIEKGERKIAIDEMINLVSIFNISVDYLLDLKKQPRIVLEESIEKKEKESQLRINLPQKNLEKFKEVLLYILNKVGSKPNIGETFLYKLLYFSDFDFYEKYEEQLIGASYQKNTYGPTPMEFAKVMEYMIKEQEIEPVKSEYFNYPQRKYLPRRKPDLSKLKAHEIETIDNVLNRLSDKNALQISEYSHKDVPWITTEEGEVIEYEAVFYRTPEYSVREYEESF